MYAEGDETGEEGGKTSHGCYLEKEAMFLVII